MKYVDDSLVRCYIGIEKKDLLLMQKRTHIRIRQVNEGFTSNHIDSCTCNLNIVWNGNLRQL